MRTGLGRLAFPASFAFWLGVCGLGFWVLLRYQTTAGKAAAAPESWPAASPLRPDPVRNTLVLFAHPQCPCTRASVDSLAWIMARSGDRLKAYALFYRPAGYPESWQKNGLWDAAAAIPGVQVLGDPEGAEARRFGARTSGQVSVYGPGGALTFEGGITGARGHVGDNAARDAVVTLVAEGYGKGTRSQVFGCSLLSDARGARNEDRNEGWPWTTLERLGTIAKR